MSRAYFNDDQNAHMDELAKTPETKRCWCGWDYVGQCFKCGNNSLADRRKAMCSQCKASPDKPGGVIWHKDTCVRKVNEEPFNHGILKIPPAGTKLVKAAVWCQERKTVFTGLRHSDVLKHMMTIGCEKPRGEETQGFLCQHGVFWDRHDGAIIAFAAGQTKEQKTVLMSEDLWDYNGVARDPNVLWDPLGDGKL